MSSQSHGKTVSSIPCPLLDVAKAKHRLSQGGVVVYPTETFFGVGCQVTNVDAIVRIFAVKQRAVHLPLPILGADIEQVECMAYVRDAERALMQLFWPGPLTLLLKAKPCVPLTVTAGTGKVAVRISSHAVARALAQAAGECLVASSANISGRPAVTDWENVDHALLCVVDGMVVEGVKPSGGLASTLAEMLPEGKLRILRSGAIATQALQTAGYAIE